MTSHVVVIDPTARRSTIKTSPSMQLSEIHQQACRKLGHDPDAYILKHNSKVLDLSLVHRLSGLINGAKLELIRSSRSPSVVSVALQYPHEDLSGLSRAIDKVPSDTSLWLILRRCESARANLGLNLTARVALESGISTNGPMYQAPVLQVMNKEYTTFFDLQKTLAQLGINSGNVLIRLTFKPTDISFEDAKRQIDQYFSSELAPETEFRRPELRQVAVENVVKNEAYYQQIDPCDLASHLQPSEALAEGQNTTAQNMHLTGQHLTILAAPDNDASLAARQTSSQSDFIPTLDHAKHHQSRLTSAGANKRLLSDGEMAAKEEAHRRRLSSLSDVEIKFRFPDQMQSISKFEKQATASTAYQFVKSLMRCSDEPILLRYSSSRGMKNLPRGGEGSGRLIADFGMEGRVLVHVVWESDASAEAKRSSFLKEEYRAIARKIEIASPEPEETPTDVDIDTSGSQGALDSQSKRNGIPKWFKVPGKK